MPRNRTTNSLRDACFLGIFVAVAGAGLSGCQKVLFPRDEPRTQYETYDNMRQKYQPLEVTDVFGTPQPALRARLSPGVD